MAAKLMWINDSIGELLVLFQSEGVLFGKCRLGKEEGMNAQARVIVIGLDSADKDLVLQWCDEGILPTIQALREKGAWATIRNPPNIYNGSVWPSFYTGLSPAKHHRYAYVKLDGYSVKGLRHTETKQEPFWNVLSRHGQKIALIDVPYAPVPEDLNGIEVIDWLPHDRTLEPPKHFDAANEPIAAINDYRTPKLFTYPASLADEVKKFDEFDDPPACERSGRSPTEFRKFRDRQVKRVKSKTDLCIHFLEQRPWDFFMTVFHEPHDVGHECWHLHDPTHPKHDPALARSLGDPIKDVYIACDTAIGRILERAGSEATAFVYCSHGMGPMADGLHVLDHVLSRLEGGPSKGLDRVVALNQAWAHTPAIMRKALTPARNRIRRKFHEALVSPTRSQRKCFAIPSNGDVGGIRINLIGREPHGLIRPGAEYDSFCKQLRQDLLELVDADSGESIIRDVVRYEDLYPRELYTEDLYNGEYLSDRADLLVVWNKASFSAVTSPKTGRVAKTSQGSRTGFHKEPGLVFACGPGIAPRALNHLVPVTDLAPTMTSMLGFPLPDADGSPVAEFCPEIRV
jgi:predicted AlkP superfamily phosphohydrolase/phosphomutase